MQNVSVAHVSFCEAYADAVVAYLATDTPHEVVFDNSSGLFKHFELDPRSAADDVDLYVGSLWTQIVGSVDVPTDPAVIGYSAGLLKSAIVVNLMKSPRTTFWRDHLMNSPGA